MSKGNLRSMVKIGILIGIYTLCLTSLGFFGLFNPWLVASLSICLGLLLIFYLFNFLGNEKTGLKESLKPNAGKLLALILFVALFVNFWGALLPETSFDALWYHLTIPKLYIEKGGIYFIPGGLLYYGGLPKLSEIIFVPALMFADETVAKLIHFVFGVLCLGVLYILGKKIFKSDYYLWPLAILAGNLVFSWEMTIASNDLAWTFYEVLAFYVFIIYLEKRRYIWLFTLGVILGLAVLAKAVAALSIFVYLILFLTVWQRDKAFPLFKAFVTVLFSSTLMFLPWLIFNYQNTGNAFYPFFTDYLVTSQRLFPLTLENLFRLIFPSDPISPLYLIFLPLTFLIWKNLRLFEKLIFFYVLLTFCMWFFTGKVGGARFLLAYLPVYSLAVVVVITQLSEKYDKRIKSLGIVLIVCVLFSTIIYRGMAQFDGLNYLRTAETKEEYLTRKLNFSFGDFYDLRSEVRSQLDEGDLVLLVGLHNLYYVDFPSVHSTWYKDQKISHVLFQGTSPPVEYAQWEAVYFNPHTNIILYKNPN